MSVYKELAIEIQQELFDVGEMINSLCYRFEYQQFIADADVVYLNRAFAKLEKVKDFYEGKYDWTDAVSTGFEPKQVSAFDKDRFKVNSSRATIYTEFELEQLRHYIDSFD